VVKTKASVSGGLTGVVLGISRDLAQQCCNVGCEGIAILEENRVKIKERNNIEGLMSVDCTCFGYVGRR